MNAPDALRGLLGILSQEPLVGRLFFASVEMAVIAGLLWLVIRVGRLRSPRLISVLWLVVLAKPLVALGVGTLLPVFEVEAPPVVMTVAAEGAAPPLLPADRTDPSDPSDQSDPSDRSLLPAPPAALPAPADPSPTLEAPQPPAPRHPPIARWLTIAWMAGVALIALYTLIERIWLHRLIARSATAPDTVLARYHALSEQLGIRRPPRLLATDALESPALAGSLLPAILVPSWLVEEADNPALDWALRHELMHWKLRDPIANAVRQLAQTLFFFHPVTWWAGFKWEEAAELACDRALVRSESEAEDYAGQLYAMLARIHGRRQRTVMGGLFATRTQIGRRVAALLSNPFKSPARLGVFSLLCVLAVAVTSLCIGGAFATNEPADEDEIVSWGEAIDGVRLRAEADATEKPFGGPALIRLSLKNDSDAPIAYGLPGCAQSGAGIYWSNGQIRVTRPDGLEQPFCAGVTPGGSVEVMPGATETGIIDLDKYFDLLEPGEYLVRLSLQVYPADMSEGGGVITGRKYGERFTVETKEFTVRLVTPDGATDENLRPFVVNGAVRNEDGSPLPGIEVRAYTSWGVLIPCPGSAVSDANGAYTLRFGPGQGSWDAANGKLRVPVQGIFIQPRDINHYELNRCRQGFIGVAEEPPGPDVGNYSPIILPGESHTINFAMAPGVSISGWLVDAQYRAIPDRYTWLQEEEDRPDGTPVGAVQTDGRGRFTFHSVPCDAPLRFGAKLGGSNVRSEELRFGKAGYRLLVLTLSENDGNEPELRMGNIVEALPLTHAEGTVRNAAGHPVAGAQVLLIPAGGTVHRGSVAQPLSRRELEQNRGIGTPSLPTSETDADGRVSMGAPTPDYLLVVDCPEGYCRVTGHDLAASTDLTLQPWARVEGTVVGPDGPVSNMAVAYSHPATGRDPVGQDPADKDRTALYATELGASTDAAGRFVFERVPPGLGHLSRGTNTPDGGGFTMPGTPVAINTQPGETTTVVLGAPAANVEGRLTLPESADLTIDWTKVHAELAVPQPGEEGPLLPGEDDFFADGMDVFLANDANRQYRRRVVPINADGTFRIEGLPAGRFILKVSVYSDATDEPWRWRLLATARHEIVVPLARGEVAALDLGDIPLELVEKDYRTNQWTDEFRVNEPMVFQLKAGTPDQPDMLRAGRITFTNNGSGFAAWLDFAALSGPKTTWRMTLSLLGGDRAIGRPSGPIAVFQPTEEKTLASVSHEHTTSGIAEGVAKWCEGQVRIDCSGWDAIPEARHFQLRVEPTEKAGDDFASIMSQAIASHARYENMRFEMSTGPGKDAPDQSAIEGTRVSRMLVSGERCRLDVPLQSNPSLEGSNSYDGQKVVWYNPDRKEAFVLPGTKRGSVESRGLPLMSLRVFREPLSQFEIRNERIQFEDVFEDTEDMSSGVTGPHGFTSRRPAKDYRRALYPGGTEKGMVIAYAKWGWDVWKVWLDPSNNWLIVRQEEYDPLRNLRTTYEVTEMSGGFVRKCTRSDPGQQTSPYECTVDSVEILAEVDPAEFEVDIPDGTFVHDKIRDIDYTKGSADDPSAPPNTNESAGQ
jgi:beta-lactamase regulating signal transducer with metallopeptidase domain